VQSRRLLLHPQSQLPEEFYHQSYHPHTLYHRHHAFLYIIAATMYLSRSIPEEVWLEIMSHLAGDRETLRNAIDAGCAASFAATKIYWANLTSDKDLLHELEELPDDQQQFFANIIRKIAIQFKPPYGEHEGRGLDFPLLRSLTIGPETPFDLRLDRSYAKIKRFVGPLMHDLDVGCEL
jgi:hypothetical protein